MKFSLSKSLEILERTPEVLIVMLQNISADWTSNNEGGASWSVFDIVGHLIEEKKQTGFQGWKLFFQIKPTKHSSHLTGLRKWKITKEKRYHNF